MKRIFSNTIVALAAGLCLRLFFVLKYPASSGDTVLYEQMATNWVKHGTYAMDVYGWITPVDLRMPGYPAFLALMYLITGREGVDARVWIMITQAAVDLLSCLLTAGLATLLFLMASERSPVRSVFVPALWLAALCPFTANYAAVPLTEVFAVFFSVAAVIPLCLLAGRLRNNGWLFITKSWRLANNPFALACCGAFLIGLGTLFRPETPLLLLAAWIVIGVVLISRHEVKRWIGTVIGMALFATTPLIPWAIRNAITLNEFQLLAPRYSNLPGELVPYGFMSWEKTWLFRFRDIYLVSWKLNDEPIRVEDIPDRAFDTEEEKARVAAILEPYNNDLTLTHEEDAAFAQLARERTSRHPLRTYLWLPAARAITMWFTPRIELLPLSGTVFPLRQAWADDRIDQCATLAFFALNLAYICLAVWGTARIWRRSSAARPAVALLIVFVLLRTAFLTSLETPEPRYVLVCFPAIIALAAQLFWGRA